MKRASSIALRHSYAGAHAIYLNAAFLAAHGAHERAGGFRASDVRFYFLLFRNWVAHDIVDPDQDIDLTQIRRALERLVDAGLARASGKSRRGRQGGRSIVLETSGIAALAEELVSGTGYRALEGDLFLVTFATCYGPLLGKRSAKTRKILDPAALLRSASLRAERLVSDLDERVRSSNALADASRAARERGASDEDIAAGLEKESAYQLNRVRPLATLLLSLPADLRAFELDQGMAMRCRLLFEPLAQRARAELEITRTLMRNLAGAV